jgi:hypothetical protein
LPVKPNLDQKQRVVDKKADFIKSVKAGKKETQQVTQKNTVKHNLQH